LSYLVFVSLDQQVDFAIIVVVYSVSVTLQSIPLGIPGEVGVVDTAMAWLFTLLTVESAVAAAATVLIRLLLVWLRIIIGFVAVQWIDLKDLAKGISKRFLKQLNASRPGGEICKFIQSINNFKNHRRHRE